jgi:prepilin-type N-terminal cleavage/methylation domain-containing protein
MPPTRQPITAIRPRARRQSGFTLVETLIASAVGAVIVGAVVTTYIISLRGFSGVANYVEIHNDGRIAVDRFARDMRAVNSVTTFNANGPVVIKIPTAFSSSGSVTASKTVTYTFSNSALYRNDSVLGNSMLATNISAVVFRLYDRVGSNTTVLSSAKGIQIDVSLQKHVASKIQSEDYLSARVAMRNIP